MKKKKQRIGLVEIEKDQIKAFDTEGKEFKLSRRQRSIFSHYKSPSFLEDVETEFNAAVNTVLAAGFYIKKNGEVVFNLF